MRLARFDNILYDAQPSNRQFINLQRAKAGLFDYQTPDSEPANRQRADGKRAKGCRAQRKRQYAGRGKGLGSSRYFARQLAGSNAVPLPRGHRVAADLMHYWISEPNQFPNSGIFMGWLSGCVLASGAGELCALCDSP